MSTSFCPATMCPLFARDGSPWTHEVNAPCEGEACGWFQDGGCEGGRASYQQVGEVAAGLPMLQIGPRTAQRRDQWSPRTFDCPRAADCQWQRESGARLCPPRYALSLGIDPKACAY